VLLVLAVQAVQPASDGQQPKHYLRGFMSLLVSALKLAGVDSQGFDPGLRFCLAETDACTLMLAPFFTAAGSTASGTASSGSSSSGGSSGSPAGACVAGLPWLVLLGRCCYYVGGKLSVALEQLQLDVSTSLDGLSSSSSELGSVLGLLCQRLGQNLSLVLSLIEVPDCAQQLGAAGYALQPVQEQISSVLSAVASVRETLNRLLTDTAAGGTVGVAVLGAVAELGL
jgi:hypothetical protein